ncbi:hypothetical protein ACLBWT_20785 [Paenibacillus sp. D51F]
MSERLLIKLVIGRTLLDTGAHSLAFQVEEGGRGWVITVSNLAAADASYIGDNIDQLNFFHFVSDDSSGLIRKFWLYDLDRPSYVYDPAMQEAVFEVDSRVAYSNEKV